MQADSHCDEELRWVVLMSVMGDLPTVENYTAAFALFESA